MPIHSNDTRRDTLGRAVSAPTSSTQDLKDATLAQGDRATVRSGFMRRDERKGAELLNDRNFGKRHDTGQAPLDGARMRHGDAIKATERIFPLTELPPAARSELVGLFQNPAVVRAFVTNPDKTIETISATKPHLKATLEAHAPFTLKDDVFRVNTESCMFKTIQREILERIPSPDLSRVSALKYSLDHLLSAPMGGAAGSEMASYKLLRSFAEEGALTVRTARAAERLETAMSTKRAAADLKIVGELAAVNRGVVHLSPAQTVSQVPIYTPQVTVPQIEPRTPAPEAPRMDTYRPTGIIDAHTSSIENRVSNSPALPGVPPQPTIMVNPPVVAPPQAPLPVAPGAQASVAGQVEISSAPSAPPSTTVELTPTMRRLVDVVNHSSLERQIGSPKSHPVLELSDRDHETLKAMLMDPVTKRELLSYSDSQLKAGFEAVRPDRIRYLEEWLAMNHRNAVNFPRMAESMAGITPADTNRIGQVVGIAAAVARERVQGVAR